MVFYLSGFVYLFCQIEVFLLVVQVVGSIVEIGLCICYFQIDVLDQVFLLVFCFFEVEVCLLNFGFFVEFVKDRYVYVQFYIGSRCLKVGFKVVVLILLLYGIESVQVW